MDGGFFWSAGWSWNASIPIVDLSLLLVVAIAALCIAWASIHRSMSSVARAMRVRNTIENARTWSHSNTSSWEGE